MRKLIAKNLYPEIAAEILDGSGPFNVLSKILGKAKLPESGFHFGIAIGDHFDDVTATANTVKVRWGATSYSIKIEFEKVSLTIETKDHDSPKIIQILASARKHGVQVGQEII